MNYEGPIVRLLKQYDQTDLDVLLTDVHEKGANAVSFVTHHYFYVADHGGATLDDPPVGWYPRSSLIFADVGQDPWHKIYETPSIDLVRAAVEMAFDKGFQKVILKPHIDCHFRSGWRGHVRVPKRLLRRFGRDYDDWLRPFAEVAQDTEADLCMGTEFWLLTKEAGADFWIERARNLRASGFSRLLTYDANWGWPTDQEAEYRMLEPLWASEYINYASVSAYYPFESAKVAQRVWEAVVKDLERVKQNTGKDVLFGEFGYPQYRGAAADPWGAHASDNPPPERYMDEARELYAVARQAVQGTLGGWLTWDAAYRSVGAHGPHNLIGSGIEQLAWGGVK